MASDRVRTFANLTYYEPRDTLLRLRAIETDVQWAALPGRVRALRTNSQKPIREVRDAALFCYAMEQRTGRSIGFAPGEGEDYDFIATWVLDGTQQFFPVQLKDVVSRDLNPSASIEEAISRLQGKYVRAHQLTVAIHLSQRARFDPAKMHVPPLELGALWVFAALTEDQSNWALWGDFLDSAGATGSPFEYPMK